jgi:hypothetical protein
MRIASIILAAAAAALAWSASAQPAGDAADRYFAELERQCPDKVLQDLSPADLRDGLDDWISGLSQDTQDQFRQAERAQCSSTDDGANCVNTTDIGSADQRGLTSDLAGSICTGFLRCRGPGDCDHAR